MLLSIYPYIYMFQVDVLLARLVASMQAQGVKSQENLANGNTESESGREPGLETDCRGRLRDLEEQLAAREAAMLEMRHKFGKNRQILTCNWEQAESELTHYIHIPTSHEEGDCYFQSA